MKRNQLLSALTASILVFCIIAASPAVAANPTHSSIQVEKVEPRYNTISKLSANLTIANGLATCTGRLIVAPGYKADISMELFCDKDPLTSWSLADATGSITFPKNIFVTSGHTYQVTVSVDVYTSSGTFIEHASEESSVVKY